MDETERLEAEYRNADDLLLHLVAREVARTGSGGSELDQAVDALVRVEWAVNDGLSRVIRWRAGQHSPLGLVARQAVAEAVAAETMRGQLPTMAAKLEFPWREAVLVRNRLRDLGPDAEEVALRLLPTWQVPLEELPDAVVALTSSPGRGGG